jgi:hypothetical protein
MGDADKRGVKRISAVFSNYRMTNEQAEMTNHVKTHLLSALIRFDRR